MSELILVVDAACVPCSTLGREVQQIPGIRMIDLDSAESLTLGTRELAPCLVEADPSGTTRIRTGWSMRLRLARHLGWRRAHRWVALLLAESRARQERVDGTRRSLLLGGLLGGLAVPVGIPPAAAATGRSRRALTSAELAKSIAAVNTRTRRAAAATRGYRISDGSVDAHALVLPDGGVLMIPLSLPEQAFVVDGASAGLAYSTLEGVRFAQITRSGRHLAVRGTANATVAEATPMSVSRFSKCFVNCLGSEVEFDCIVDCALLNTLECFLCAGYLGVSCALKCAKYF